jgi:hypothetical protein
MARKGAAAVAPPGVTFRVSLVNANRPQDRLLSWSGDISASALSSQRKLRR